MVSSRNNEPRKADPFLTICRSFIVKDVQRIQNNGLPNPGA